MREPVYDDMTLDWIEQENRQDLVGQIWQYVLALEEYVVRLREQVNVLSKNQALKIPYPDPASDFCIRFNDHRAYLQFSESLPDGIPEWKISDLCLSLERLSLRLPVPAKAE